MFLPSFFFKMVLKYDYDYVDRSGFISMVDREIEMKLFQ